jgi:hypothetical protein
MRKTVLDTIFPFSIVLALAIGEAFKQCVAEHRPGADQTGGVRGGSIQWDRMAGLLTFLLLMLPFYNGMNRYLLLTYGGEPGADHKYSAIASIIDGATFLAESAAFFAMSRNLAETRWKYFYWMVLFLLVVDTCWGFSAQLHPHDETTQILTGWMKLNLEFSGVLLLLIFVGSGFKDRDRTIAIFGTFAMLIRTIIDYWIFWDFYFS